MNQVMKEIDLSKGVKSRHPDIIPGKMYLVKFSHIDTWYFGPFVEVWFGLSFTRWGTSGIQFDTPGYNRSNWERVIEVDVESL